MKFEIYKKAIDFSELEETIKLLKDNNIKFKIEETKETSDPLQVYYNSGFNYFLRIDSNDRCKVDELVSKSFAITLNDIPKDYYLFDYGNNDLLEIITFKDEWSQYDCTIAESILKERGINPIEVSADTIKRIKLKHESETEPNPKLWLIIGYASALLGGLIGLVTGLTMWLSKRTLSDGSKIYDFDENDRKQGKLITILSLIFFVLWIYIAIKWHPLYR